MLDRFEEESWTTSGRGAPCPHTNDDDGLAPTPALDSDIGRVQDRVHLLQPLQRKEGPTQGLGVSSLD